MKTTQLKTRNGQYAHEMLANIIKKAGFHIEVQHNRTPYTMHLPSGRAKNVVGETLVTIYDKNPKQSDANIVAAGDAQCIEGDNFCKRLGVTFAMRRAYANLRSENAITRKQALSLV